LQEHYVNFELARALNDYGYVLRELGRYQEAQQAIEESIRLKKSNAALPHSIAIALSELSQILLRQGMIQQAKILNGEAVQLLEKAVEDGDSAHQPELGMLLVERADILWQQAQLAEALPLLERAVLLIGDKPSRQQYKQQAKKQIDEIRLITSSGHTYQLDRRWFSRYSELVAYDDLFLLTQAGPFTEDEQEEWAKLFPHRGDEESKNRLLALAAQSRKRESTRSLQEGGIPVICYPCLLPEDMVEDLQERSHGLAELRRDIEKQEKNVVVRRLYLDAIEEQLAILRLMEAVVSQDQETAWQSNLQLYGKPSEREVKIALQALYATLSDARHNDLAESVAREITAQLKAWNLSLFDIASEELFLPQQERDLQEDCGVLIDEKRQFPTGVVRVFFQDVLSAYGADDWKVSISPARDYTYVNPNERRLVLPQKTFSVGKIRQLLAEEVETHTFRALAGQRSSLALLGLGLARQEATEEGLAKWYIKHVNQRVGVKQQENTWIGTLATGLAAGILTPMLSFQELRSFLEKYYLVHRLLEKEESQEESLVAAKLSAWARVCRTFRGIPDLSQPGCSLKDGVYLRGHLEVSRYFECGGDEQRLWVGAVGIEHLEDLAELNILAPNFPHRHFALAPDLPDQLSRYDKKVLSTENKPST
jgi:tetratricopeptide (TPR) repeat protein